MAPVSAIPRLLARHHLTFDEIAPIFAVGVEPNLGTPGALVVHRSGTCEELPHLPVRPR